MKRLIDIENELREVAKSNNMVGDSVELLVKLLAYNRYEALTSTRVSLLESLPDRANNLNSKITHAMNEMYSIYRGYNSTLKVRIKVNGNLQLNKFDKVYSDRNNTLFYSHWEDDNGVRTEGNYNFSYGREYNIVLIKGTTLEEEILSVDEDNKYLLETLSPNISEIYELSSSVNPDISIKTTKDFGLHIDRGLDSSLPDYNPLAFDLTIPDYGLRVYAPDDRGFNTSSTYTLRYLPFNSKDIDANDVQKLNIPGARVLLDTLEVMDHTPREEVSNFLYNLKREAVTQNRTRSNSDIVDSFKASFSKKIKDVVLGDYDLETDTLTLHYIPLGSEAEDPMNFPSPYELSELDKSTFIGKLLYYVTKKINFVPLYDKTHATNLDLDINIYMYANIDIEEVSKKLKSYEYKIGNTINKHELVGYINSMEGVRYCTVDIFDKNDVENSDTPIEVKELGNDSYFLISPNINYTYRI